MQAVKLQINFASGTYHLKRRLASWLTIACLVGGVFECGLLYHYFVLANQVSQNEKRLVVLPLAAHPADLIALKKQVRDMNMVLHQHAFLWSELLTDMEKIVPSGISLRAFKPQGITDQIEIEGETRTVENLVAFLRALETSPSFSKTFLLKQQETKEGTLTFTLRCYYQPEILKESDGRSL